jgi:hypothetical protein
MYTTTRQEQRHARKAWLGTLEDPCLLSGQPPLLQIFNTPSAGGDSNGIFLGQVFHTSDVDLLPYRLAVGNSMRLSGI